MILFFPRNGYNPHPSIFNPLQESHHAPSPMIAAGDELPSRAPPPTPPHAEADLVVTVAALEAQKCCGVAIEVERVCRICHLSPEHGGKEKDELIQLGCGCKDDLGAAHRACAEAWFRIKGDRYCEICGSNAKNITGEEDRQFMAEWHEGRMPIRNSNTNSSERGGCWRSQPCCNFLMACLIVAFILPWFFGIKMF